MATPDVQELAERLFMGFLSPLVLGGAMMPGRPIGARAALALGDAGASASPGDYQGARPLGDPERVSLVQLARVRCARRLVAVDRFEGISGAEWALGAALHDIVQSAHPDLRGTFRPRAPMKLMALAETTIERVPPARTIAEALSRHTWFSRLFEITRTDTVVSWWVGAQTFLGEDPPTRLTSWPELRRVNQVRTPRALIDLPTSGGTIDPDRYARALLAFLERTPLTDLATCGRTLPAFAWSADTLSFVATRAGRTLALRAMAMSGAGDVDEALGRATRQLFTARSWKYATIALDLLGERALADAGTKVSKTNGALEAASGAGADDAGFARGIGAVAAQRWIATHGGCFGEAERGRLLEILEPAATSRHAGELNALLATAASGTRSEPAK